LYEHLQSLTTLKAQAETEMVEVVVVVAIVLLAPEL
jgi:hypothetical protein